MIFSQTVAHQQGKSQGGIFCGSILQLIMGQQASSNSIIQEKHTQFQVLLVHSRATLWVAFFSQLPYNRCSTRLQTHSQIYLTRSLQQQFLLSIQVSQHPADKPPANATSSNNNDHTKRSRVPIHIRGP
jgi:hypothetical protein